MIKQFIFTLAALLTLSQLASAQRFMTRSGHVEFFSHTTMEDIKADNNQVAAVMDATAGTIAYTVLIKSFQFEKALMQEHFNENYMESDKYPKATFSGKVKDMSKVDLTKDGEYKIIVDGNLTMKDKTNAVSIPGSIIVKGGKVEHKAKFTINPNDYNVSIPAVVKEKIAKDIEITVDAALDPMSR